MSNTQPISKTDEQEKLKQAIISDGPNTRYFQSRLHELAFYYSQLTEYQTNIYDTHLQFRPIHGKDISRARDLRKLHLALFHDSKSKELAELGIDANEVTQNIKMAFAQLTLGKLT
ncbi:hypothetical protein ASV39_000856 [Vibrio parahaemolyticus]|nr:hypothetical protein [Vibrio parahaemolyticus]